MGDSLPLNYVDSEYVSLKFNSLTLSCDLSNLAYVFLSKKKKKLSYKDFVLIPQTLFLVYPNLILGSDSSKILKWNSLQFSSRMFLDISIADFSSLSEVLLFCAFSPLVDFKDTPILACKLTRFLVSCHTCSGSCFSGLRWKLEGTPVHLCSWWRQTAVLLGSSKELSSGSGFYGEAERGQRWQDCSYTFITARRSMFQLIFLFDSISYYFDTYMWCARYIV